MISLAITLHFPVKGLYNKNNLVLADKYDTGAARCRKRPLMEREIPNVGALFGWQIYFYLKFDNNSN
ncbi:MAG: hypothetical protein ABI760_21010 [Ferruginibacter sp.]